MNLTLATGTTECPSFYSKMTYITIRLSVQHHKYNGKYYMYNVFKMRSVVDIFRGNENVKRIHALFWEMLFFDTGM